MSQIKKEAAELAAEIRRDIEEFEFDITDDLALLEKLGG